MTTVRTLCGRDVEPVLGIWNRALVRDPIDEGRFVRHVLADPDYWPGDDSGFVVAEADGDVVGFCRAIVRRWPNDRLGVEPEDGFVSALAVDPAMQGRGVGSRLIETALEYFGRQGRKRAWVCGTPTSAPGSFVPGVDREAYPAALPLFGKHGFAVDQFGYSMARSVVDLELEEFRRTAWATGPQVEVTGVGAGDVQDLLSYVAAELPGSWTIAARQKIQSGRTEEMLIARLGGRIVGHCQWTGEHFGPFGVARTARNMRIGAKLFTEALARIRLNGGRRVWFNWADDEARRFYERFGLTVTRQFSILRKNL